VAHRPPGGSTAFQRFCDELAKASGADDFLVLPGVPVNSGHGPGGRSRRADTLVDRAARRLTPPRRVGVAVGPAALGSRMRRSLQWALECRRVATVCGPLAV